MNERYSHHEGFLLGVHTGPIDQKALLELMVKDPAVLAEALNLAYVEGRIVGRRESAAAALSLMKEVTESEVAIDVALHRAIKASEGVDLPPEDADVTPCPDCHRRHSPLVRCSTPKAAPVVRTGQGAYIRDWPEIRDAGPPTGGPEGGGE